MWPSTADRRDHRRGLWLRSRRRRPWRRRAGAVVWLFATFATPRTGGLVLPLPCALASECAAHLPLAFAIQHSLDCLAAGGATITSLAAARLLGRFVASGSVAQGRRRKNICCVTTRRRNLRGFRHLWRRGDSTCAPPTARTFHRGVLDFGRLPLTPADLAPRSLPPPYQTLAVSILAVTLVPTPWLILASTPLAQTEPRPRSPRTLTAATVWRIMATTHGSCDLPRDSPGANRSCSPRALLNTTKRSSANLYAENRLRKKWFEKRAANKNANQTGARQRRKRLRTAQPKRRSRTRCHWRSPNAHKWITFLARYHASNFVIGIAPLDCNFLETSAIWGSNFSSTIITFSFVDTMIQQKTVESFGRNQHGQEGATRRREQVASDS